MLYLKYVPGFIRNRLIQYAGYLSIPGSKYAGEFYYWYTQYQKQSGRLDNTWYRGLMLAMAGQSHEDFVQNKVVADFGCGPRGSLCWAQGAKDRIGIDVLADKYTYFGTDEQPMRYVCCSEIEIPLPDESVDVLFTLNAMDHVNDLEAMCSEVLRILKPGGEFIGSFNLEEETSVCEPQTLTEQKLADLLLDNLHIESYRMARHGPRGNNYKHFFDDSPQPTSGPRYLWVRARKD